MKKSLGIIMGVFLLSLACKKDWKEIENQRIIYLQKEKQIVQTIVEKHQAIQQQFPNDYLIQEKLKKDILSLYRQFLDLRERSLASSLDYLQKYTGVRREYLHDHLRGVLSVSFFKKYLTLPTLSKKAFWLRYRDTVITTKGRIDRIDLTKKGEFLTAVRLVHTIYMLKRGFWPIVVLHLYWKESDAIYSLRIFSDVDVSFRLKGFAMADYGPIHLLILEGEGVSIKETGFLGNPNLVSPKPSLVYSFDYTKAKEEWVKKAINVSAIQQATNEEKAKPKAPKTIQKQEKKQEKKQPKSKPAKTEEEFTDDW